MRRRQFPALESLERRALLSGVTLITHGFGGSAGDWVTTMGNLIAQQSGALAEQPRYLMTVTDIGHDGGPLTVTSARLSGAPAPAQWGSREIVVLLDWSDVAGSFPFGGYHRPTAHVGAAVAQKLLGAFSVPDLAAPLAQLPIHLLGHSRGASLISEIARGLGARGVWVDQLTFFDPHPVDGVADPLGLDFDDAPMRVFENVQFADNYWRTDGATSFDFTGEAVNGAFNLQLTESVLTGTGYSVEHSDTHLFYHGTIGPVGGPFQDSDGGAAVGANWYAAPHPSRDATGWRHARIAASGARPAAGLKSAGAHRDAMTLTATGAAVWDNVQINGLLSDLTLVQGTPLTVPVQFADRNDDATITVGFDRDDDPYNGVFSSVSIASASVSGGEAMLVDVPTTDIAGAFRVFAQIDNGTNARHYYAPARAIITAAGFDRTWIGPATGQWSVASNWSGGAAPAAGESAAIYDSAVIVAADVRVTGLHLNSAARLDLRDHNLVVDYADDAASPVALLTNRLASGRAAGDWNGPAGIVSSAAASGGGVTALAIAETAAVRPLEAGATTLWRGHIVDASSVLIGYTFDGDANLDGLVSGDDYTAIDFAIAVPGASGYSNGDFNYDGLISGDDYTIIDFTLAAQHGFS